MKKWILILFLFLAAVVVGAWVASTYFFSSMTGAWLSGEMEKLEQQTGASGVLDLEQSDFKKGFTSSEATTAIRLTNVPTEGMENVTLKHRIYHGPLAMTPDGLKFCSNYVVTTLDVAGLPEEAREVVKTGFQGEEPFTLKMAASLTGEMNADFQMPTFGFDIEGADGGGRIDFEGIDGSFSGSQQRGDGKIMIGGLKIAGKEDGFVFDMAPSTITADFRGMSDGIPTDADAEYSFPQFTVTAEGKTFRVDDMAAIYEVSSEDGSAMEGRYEISIGAVKLPAGEAFDPYRDAVTNGARMGFDVRGMEIEALKALMEAQQEMQKAQAEMMGKGTSEMTPESIRASQDAAMAYMKSVFELIQEGFGMGMAIGLGTGAGESKLSLNIDYTGKGKSTDLETMGELVSALSGDVTLRVNKSLIPEAQAAMLAQPMEMGFILDKGTHYESSAKLSNATADLNGQPVPLLEQMGPQANAPIPWEQIFQGGAMGLQQ